MNTAQTIGSNGFQKRELILTTVEQYPQMILVEFIQDKCDLLDNYNIGDMVVVSINLRGREWINAEGQTKYFNTIQGWKIALNDASNNPPPVPRFSENDEDLPF
ncbi:DUF3127 domain-containing protein [Gelidibacter algens]|uniref:DUF3127 domain-containing protein n=1 Tax=Gelidibacter algens TaxID=49280 RepID=UPI000804B627|nr:DUF3127 domain-containing protein [Gelidibacter algens]OBX17586.1 hypothetical protein A9996_19260 [Gelidibacter algens]